MQRATWEFLKEHYTGKSNNMTWSRLFTPAMSLMAMILITQLIGCGVYSFKGITTNARNISIQEFYNNAELGPATMGQTFTNSLKNYFIQNSNLSVIAQDGELQMEGEITGFTLMPIAPTAADASGFTPASQTRLTISIKVTYINTLDESMSFKDKVFSFYRDFPGDQNLSDVEEALVREIFDRLVNDIFNASVANW